MNSVELGNGFGGYFTRTGSFILLVLSSFMLFSPESVDMTSYEVDQMFGWIITWWLLSMHGVFTTMDEVGIFRKLLCHLSGVAGAVVAFNVIGQILAMS